MDQQEALPAEPMQPTWLARNAENLVFTAGFASIVVGCFCIHTAAGFIVPGVMVCGLMILNRLRRRPLQRSDKNA